MPLRLSLLGVWRVIYPSDTCLSTAWIFLVGKLKLWVMFGQQPRQTLMHRQVSLSFGRGEGHLSLIPVGPSGYEGSWIDRGLFSFLERSCDVRYMVTTFFCVALYTYEESTTRSFQLKEKVYQVRYVNTSYLKKGLLYTECWERRFSDWLWCVFSDVIGCLKNFERKSAMKVKTEWAEYSCQNTVCKRSLPTRNYSRLTTSNADALYQCGKSSFDVVN